MRQLFFYINLDVFRLKVFLDKPHETCYNNYVIKRRWLWVG